jgi:hypothetical protein
MERQGGGDFAPLFSGRLSRPVVAGATFPLGRAQGGQKLSNQS